VKPFAAFADSIKFISAYLAGALEPEDRSETDSAVSGAETKAEGKVSGWLLLLKVLIVSPFISAPPKTK
jgi:hypothetical protein